MMGLFILFILIVIGAGITYFVMSNNLNLIDLIDLLSDSLKESSSNTGNQNKYIEVDESQLNDDLSSATGLNYRKLRNLLAVGNFESANKETESLIFSLLGVKFINMTGTDEPLIKYIPCTDILTIDRLWVKYSNGRFGFSVQGVIWRELVRNCHNEIIEFSRREKIDKNQDEALTEAIFRVSITIYKKLGWSGSDTSPIYEISAPVGHLPIIFPNSTGSYNTMISFFGRVRKCLE